MVENRKPIQFAPLQKLYSWNLSGYTLIIMVGECGTIHYPDSYLALSLCIGALLGHRIWCRKPCCSSNIKKKGYVLFHWIIILITFI